jgi:hypothetical protein
VEHSENAVIYAVANLVNGSVVLIAGYFENPGAAEQYARERGWPSYDVAPLMVDLDRNKHVRWRAASATPP